MDGELELWDLIKETCTYKIEIPFDHPIHVLSGFYFAVIENYCINVYSLDYLHAAGGKFIHKIKLIYHKRHESIECLTIDRFGSLTKILYITERGGFGIVSCQQ